MLEFAHGLSPPALRALAELEARSVAVDGGRLKLEWGVLKTRSGRDVEDVLWWDGERLVGYVGIYAFGPPAVELAVMVDPAWRRRGIATALLDAALPLCRDRGYQRALLVTPHTSAAGRCFALRRGAVLEHSEHALELEGPPLEGPPLKGPPLKGPPLKGPPLEGPSKWPIALRRARPVDAPVVAKLLTAAFGHPTPDLQEQLTDESERTLLVEVEGSPVGTLRLTRHESTGGVYGLAVDPSWQGRGVGRQVLRQVCQQLREEGVERVHLEVSVDNDRALGLYTSIGFTEVATEDYYALSCQ